MGKQPHIVAVAYPAQGHVAPLLKLCYKIAGQGIKVTFVNTEFIHSKVMRKSSPNEKDRTSLTFASIPDGLKHDDDRKDFLKLTHSLCRSMSGYLGELIEKINQSDEPVTCILADLTVGWIMDVAEKFGVEKVGFAPGSPAVMALACEVPKLFDAGQIDSNGNLTKGEQISLSKEIPAWNNMEFTWSVPGDLVLQKFFFESSLSFKGFADGVNWLLCNTFYELDSSSCNLIPNLVTIGPLVTSTKIEKYASSGSFWLEDESCLNWLDKQKPGSVVYVAFGSIPVFSQEQFDELAFGIELSGRPFLWVVRSDFINGFPNCFDFPDGFLDRVAGLGKIVEWAPQVKVLSHSSIACFISHCGWNSTIEGISHGVPLLCWPYFADQFHNQSFICEFWNVGLKLNPSSNGIRSRNEICTKIENLLSDELIKVNALRLKDLAQISNSQDGSSSKNFAKFINHLKC